MTTRARQTRKPTSRLAFLTAGLSICALLTTSLASAQTATEAPPPAPVPVAVPVATEAPTTTAPPVPVAVATTAPVPATTAATVATVAPGPVPVATGSPASVTTLDPSVISVVESTSTSTTIDPLLTTTTTLIPIESTSSTSTTLPEIVPFDENIEVEEPPQIATPILPPPKVPPRNQSLEDALKQLGEKQRTLIAIQQKRADIALAKLKTSTEAINQLRERESDISSQVGELERRMSGTRQRLHDRAIAIFTGSDAEVVDGFLSAESANDMTRNVEYASQVQKNDRSLIDGFVNQQKDLETKRADLTILVEERQIELETVIAEQQALGDALEKMQNELASITSGASIALGGFVFPVSSPFNFVDTYGAPRMTGSKYQHSHQGTDIFGPYGSPVFAVSQGVIAKQAYAVLGGWKLWLKSTDGTAYYYAHLSAYVDGVTNGSVVEAGDVIGFLGDSGNAKGTPPHVHFEVHPGDGPAVNPYPFLDAVRKNDISEFLRAQKAAAAAATTVPPPTIPGQIDAGVGIVREVAIGEVVVAAAGPATTLAPGAPSTTRPMPFLPAPTQPS